MKKVAKLVYVTLLTRVIVDENADDETIMAEALPKLKVTLAESAMENIEKIVDDEAVPFSLWDYARVGNLLRMADYIKTIPQSKFGMAKFRNGETRRTIKCNSIGCVIGHCTVLDEEPEKIPRYHGYIDFVKWSEKFTGLKHDSDEWDWCFSGGWFNTDNTPLGASKRIEFLINYGLPIDWKEQKNGEVKLIYQD